MVPLPSILVHWHLMYQVGLKSLNHGRERVEKQETMIAIWDLCGLFIKDTDCLAIGKCHTG